MAHKVTLSNGTDARRDLINSLGGAEVVGSWFGISASAVRNAVHRGGLPSDWFRVINERMGGAAPWELFNFRSEASVAPPPQRAIIANSGGAAQ